MEVKIVIITLHRVFNYGSILQAYATQKVFEKNGCKVEIVDYITEQRTNRKLFLELPDNIVDNHASKSIYIFLRFFSVLIKKLIFGSFLRKHCNLTSQRYITSEDIIKNPPEADIYVTGSDQVWNSKYNEGIDKGFFLEFAPKDKIKISFASSFGKSQLDENERNTIKEYLGRYNAISVREDDARQIIREMGYNSEWIIDPTLQLKKEEWLGIASPRLVKERYLILMLLYNEDNGATEYAREIADKKGLKLIKLSWELIKPHKVDRLLTHRSPQDFLSLFFYADFVVTNSFHGLAFSINFNRQFVMVPRNEFNSRIESLLRLTGLENRLVNTTEQAIQVSKEIIDYNMVNKKIEMERTKANEFVERIIV